MIQSKQTTLFVIFMVLFSLAGAALLAYMTPQGMGLVNDSVGYIAGARNLVLGDGYSRLTGNGEPRPITNYPPLYSFFLALPIMLGVDSLVAARWLNLALFALGAVLAGLIVLRLSRSKLFGVLGTGLFVASRPFIDAYTYALSESVFILVYFLALYYLIVYLQEKRKTSLIIVGLLSSLAVLTRYVGISLFPTVMVCLFIFQPTWRERIRDSLIYAGSSLPGILAWVLRNILVTGNPANRQFIFHPIPMDKLHEGVLNFWRWLLPERGNLVERFLPVWGVIFLIGLIVMIGLIGFALWLAYRRKPLLHESWFIPSLVIGLQALSFFAVLFFSLFFVDASPPLDDRIILPFTLCIFLLIVGFMAWLWSQRATVLKGMGVLLAVLLFLSYSEDTLDRARLLHQDGQGFASSYWQESQTVEAVTRYPDRIIFTNKPTALYILIDRPAYILLSPNNPATGLPREDYPEFVQTVRERVMDGRALLVIFDYEIIMGIPEERVWVEEIVDGLPVLEEHEEGVIFGLETQ